MWTELRCDFLLWFTDWLIWFLPLKVDGEPCRLAPSVIYISLRNQANMIQKTKRRTSIPHLNEYDFVIIDNCIMIIIMMMMMSACMPVSSMSQTDWESGSAESVWLTMRLCTMTRINYGKHVRTHGYNPWTKEFFWIHLHFCSCRFNCIP